jgi:hypothetical protein
MLLATRHLTNRPPHLFTTVTLTIAFCAASALLIVNWMPGESGLPADIAAIQLQNVAG